MEWVEKALIGACIVLACGLALWALLWAIGSAYVAKKGERSRPPSPPQTPPAAAVPHQGHDSGHGAAHGAHDDHHSSGPSALTIALVALVVVVGVCFLFGWLNKLNEESLERMSPTPSERSSEPSRSAEADREVPQDIVYCRGLETPAATIQPGDSINVWVERQAGRDTRFSAKPDTSDGTITMCDYYNHWSCSTPHFARTMRTSVFRVTNITNGTAPRAVPFFCTDGYEHTR